MRSLFATLLSVSLASAVPVSSGLFPAQATAAAPSPEQLYEEGRKAFRLGRYDEAVHKFEDAYAASDNALLLYNIALAYRRWYGVSGNIDHLRKAKAVFQNFLLEASRDSTMDPSDAESQVKEIEEELRKAEEEEGKRREAASTSKKTPDDDRTGPVGPVRQGPDPGRKLRFAGIGLMAGGGVLVATGIVGAVLFGLKGQEFEEDLRNNRAQQDAMNCDSSTSTECQTLEDQAETLRNNGRLANVYTVVFPAVFGVIGAAALGTGAGLFVVGNKRTGKWERGETVRVRLLPTWGGIVLSGEF